MSDTSTVIEVQDLRKTYGSFVALDGVSLQVQRGEILGLLGPNGAGKTTLMRILTGFMPADSGFVTVCDFDVVSESERTRNSIGYLPENAPLYEDMNVLDYLMYFARLKGIKGDKCFSAVAEKARQCALFDVLQKQVGQLSKGYRQRVGLAQALLADPPVLILDEPTSGLDPNQILDIRDLIRRIGRERTVLLSTHILSEVQATCDRVVIIDHGKVVATGSPEELTTSQGSQGRITVALKGKENEHKDDLSSIEGIHSVHSLGRPREGVARYELACGNDTELTEKIFAKAVEKGWTMSELNQASATLEDVFIRLTGKEGGHA